MHLLGDSSSLDSTSLSSSDVQLFNVNSSVPGTARLPIWQDTLIRGLSLFLSTGWREPKTLGIAGRLADNYDTSLRTAIAKVQSYLII